MTPLALTLLYMSVVWVTPALEPVYARHFREDALGAELRALELAEQVEFAAVTARVPVALLAAVLEDESGFNAQAFGARGELGPAQLLPGTPWFRGWFAECAQMPARPDPSPVNSRPSFWAWKCAGCQAPCEAANVLWGAYALRESINACGGDEHLALGRYRTGRCVAGPRGAATLELAQWLGSMLEQG